MPKLTAARIAEIRGHLATIEHGDRTVAEVAREIGVAAWTIYSWKRRFTAASSGRRQPVRAADIKAELIEVEQPPASEPIEIIIGQMTVRVPHAFDPIELQRVLSMLSLPPSIRILLARGVTDMRKQIDGLAGLVEHALKHDPFSGHLFVFCNRARNRLKILYWEEGGYWLLHKRLERGRFAWPDGDSPVIKLSAAQLHVLLGGLDLRGARQRRRYQRKDEPVNPVDPAHA